MMEAEPEVWKQLIEEKPEAAKWMTMPISNYGKLYDLIGQDRATGDGAYTAKERRRQLDENASSMDTINDIDQMVSQDECILEGFRTRTSQANVQSVPLKTKKSKTTHGGDEAKIVKEAIGLALSIREGNTVYKKIHSQTHKEEDVYQKLVNIGVESDMLPNCYLCLIRNPDMMRAFFVVHLYHARRF